MLLVCEFCGEEFASNRKKRFCSKECQLSRHNQCKGCGVRYVCRRQGRSVYCSLGCANRANGKGKRCHICLWCASMFTIKTPSSRNNGKYCSRECRFEYLAWRTEVRGVQAEGDIWRLNASEKRECNNCGGVFESTNGRLRCSSQCDKEYATLVAKKKHAEKYVPKLSWRECLWCGKMFCSSKTKTCSKRCRRKNKQRSGGDYRERCAFYGVHYDSSITRRKVFKRDDWTCQECGIKCRRDGEYLEDDAPELDHFIPLSKGGTHTWDNTRCLCRKCNAEKSDAMPGTLFMV